MALSIKAAEADELARSLARLTGESMTEAVTAALRERLARERARRAVSAELRGAGRSPRRAAALGLRHAAREPGRMGRCDLVAAVPYRVHGRRSDFEKKILALQLQVAALSAIVAPTLWLVLRIAAKAGALPG